MQDARIRFGVIGMGPSNMASTLALLDDEPDLRYEITAACARRPDVLEETATMYGIPFWTTDYRELVCRDSVDVVSVCSPDALHAEHCAAALRCGKHVVCTKPMVATLDDAQLLVDLVRQQGSLQAEFTDNEPGEVRMVLDGVPGQKAWRAEFEAERDMSAYGHGATVIRYMRHFQACLDNDEEPSPGALHGAKSVAAGVAAWESARTGQSVEVFKGF